MTPDSRLLRARAILAAESEGLRHVADRLDDSFSTLVDRCLSCEGRIILMGMGKSGLVARKITATLQSLATPAYFLSPAEGFHGDLGLIQSSDLVLLISNSGTTEELINLLPSLKKLGVVLVALTGRPDSTLGRACDVVCDLAVPSEADAHNLVPSTSTTALMAFGDALALVLFEERGLTATDFAQFHPGGALGRRLLLRVEDVMHKESSAAILGVDATFGQAIDALTRTHLGAIMLRDTEGRLAGFLTDGDVRRTLDRSRERTIEATFAMPVSDAMTPNPKRAYPNELASVVLDRMRERQHQQAPVVDDDDKVVGLIRLLDLIQAGL